MTGQRSNQLNYVPYLRYRRGFTALNYWEVLDATEKRYKEFLKYRETSQ
jgi:hypothetical protein